MELDEYFFNGLLRILSRKKIANEKMIENEIKAIKRGERADAKKNALKNILNSEEFEAVREIFKQRLRLGPAGWAGGMLHTQILIPMSKRLDNVNTIGELERIYDVITDHRRICVDIHGVEYTPKPIIKEVRKKLCKSIRKLRDD